MTALMMPSPKTEMYFDENSTFRSVDACSHLFSSCSTLEDNLFASIAINRGAGAALADALRYGWEISSPLVDYIRSMLSESPTHPGGYYIEEGEWGGVSKGGRDMLQNMNRQDWALLAVDRAGTGGLSPVQIQKILFLLGKELPNEITIPFYNFVPHNYGPFCKDVYSDAERLAADGLVAIERKSAGYPEYRITPPGSERAMAVAREATPRLLEYLESIVGWAQRQSFSGLVRAIYAKYPEFRVNSVFND
ncbi:MAG TPA: hypothetical protein VK335_11310 [Bryobacteraceae bacterium]|nr:hypothetical protein [Bryobacteraceae bacterium]